MRGDVRPGTLVVSLAAGIPTTYVEQRLPDGTPVVRVMPNTPALVDEGMAAISPGAHCAEAHLEQVESMLRAVGRVVRVPEKHQDAVTAISGSGPAYLFYVVEAMIEAGVLLGLPRVTATELTVQTLVGAGKMLRETGAPHRAARERLLTGGHDGGGAARTRRPQGARGVPHGNGGCSRPLTCPGQRQRGGWRVVDPLLVRWINREMPTRAGT